LFVLPILGLHLPARLCIIPFMLTGYNTDFKFKGKVYHIQTEDGGANSPYITSLLYHGGAIIGTRKTSYADIIRADCLDEVMRELMMEQHKQVIRDFMQGKLESGQAPQQMAQPAPEPAPTPAKKEPPPAPAAKPAPTAEEIKDTGEKSLDEVILDFLAQEQKARGQKK